MASLLSLTTLTVPYGWITTESPAEAHCEYAPQSKQKEYPTGQRASGPAVVSNNGREFGARVTGVRWVKKGRDNAAGFTGWEPVPVFRVGNQRPPLRRLNARPLSGLTLPRRCGAHGR